MSGLSMGLIKADIITASSGIDYFENNKTKDIKNIIAYHLQQAVEKMIKIQIYRSGVTYDNAQVFSHNLRNLYRYAISLGIEIEMPPQIENNLAMITTWEAGSRYDIHFSIRIDTLKKHLRLVEEWYQQLYDMGMR